MEKHYKNFVLSKKTEVFFLGVITFNTILLCLDGDSSIELSKTFIDEANNVITYVFLAEMLMKLMALGIKSNNFLFF